MNSVEIEIFGDIPREQCAPALPRVEIGEISKKIGTLKCVTIVRVKCLQYAQIIWNCVYSIW